MNKYVTRPPRNKKIYFTKLSSVQYLPMLINWKISSSILKYNAGIKEQLKKNKIVIVHH